MIISKSGYNIGICHLLIIAPLLVAIINGFFIAAFDINLPVGGLFRSLTLVYVIPFFFLTPFRLKGYLLFLLVLWVPLTGIWFINNETFLITRELEQLLKLLFPFLIASVLIKKSIYFSTEPYKFLITFAVIASLCIFFSFFSGLHVEKQRAYEFGINSFFIARNEISLTLVSIMPFVLFEYLSTKQKKYLYITFMLTFSLILLGSKSAFLGVGIITFSILIIFMRSSRRQVPLSKLSRVIFFIVVSFLGLGLIIISYRIISMYPHMVEDFSSSFQEHPRALLIEIAQDIFKQRELKNWVGEGFYSFGNTVESIHPANSESGVGKLTENDPYDLWGAYGFIYGTMWLIPILLIWLKNVITLTVKYNTFKYLKFISLTLILFHSILVGHALMSPLVSSVLAIHYLYDLKVIRSK